jgi:hypothetical protein
MDSTLTFDQMERNADQTLAFVLWAKNVKNMALAAAWMAVLDRVAKHLVKTLSHDQKLASLSDEQAMDLAKKLQEIHYQMDFLLRRTTVAQWRTKMLFAASLDGIAASTDDVADILEDLILSCSPEFRSILVGCVRALPSHSAELVGRM